MKQNSRTQLITDKLCTGVRNVVGQYPAFRAGEYKLPSCHYQGLLRIHLPFPSYIDRVQVSSRVADNLYGDEALYA